MAQGEQGQLLGAGGERKEFCYSDMVKEIREEELMMTDPVCGMKVDENSKSQTQFAGKKYFFCSDQCRKEFEADPDEYVETTAA